MSIECAYCERDLRGGHASDCDRPRKTAPKRAVNPNPLEKIIEAKIGQYAKSKGCLYYKFTSPANRAVPDRVIVSPCGDVFFLELKRKGQKPTPLQWRELKRLESKGCNVGFCDDVHGGEWLINYIVGHPGLKGARYRMEEFTM